MPENLDGRITDANFEHSLYFTAPNSAQPILTITPGGKLVIGEGMSQDEATKAVAEQLVAYFAIAMNARIGALAAENAELRRQIAAAPPLSLSPGGPTAA